MSYVSLLKSIPEFFSQPTGIAAIASLSLHGAIALIVPLMPSTSNKNPQPELNQASVGLIELSPADQSRLPPIPGTSQVAAQVPQLPMQQTLPSNSYGNTLTLLPPTPNDPQVATPLPSNQLPSTITSNSGYQINRLPERRIISRINPNAYRAPLNLRSNSKNYSSNFGSPSTFRTGSTQNYENSPGNFNQPFETQAGRNTNRDEQELKNPSPGEIDPGFTVGGEPIPPQNRGDSADRFNQNPNLAGNNNSPNRDLLAANPSTTKDENLTGGAVGRQQAQLDEFTKLRRQVSLLHPQAQEKNPIRRTSSTDKSDLEGNISGWIVLDSNGKMDIYFSRATPLELQSKAREYFKANPPTSEKEKTTSYPFSLSFKHQNRENTSNKPEVNSESRVGQQDNNNTVNKPETKPESRVEQQNNTNTVNKPETKPNPTSEKKDPQTGNGVVIPNSTTSTTDSNNDSNKPVVIKASPEKLIQKLRDLKQDGQNSQPKDK
jgi:hypothetical protein